MAVLLLAVLEMQGESVELAGKYILVVGLGRSGAAAARFLAARGARVRVTDMAPAAALGPVVAEMGDLGVELDLGGHSPEGFERAELIVLSPGVPPGIAPVAAARRRGVPVWGEMELALHFITVPIVGVTGTNGKTTTTRLIAEMLEASGLKVFCGGNIGNPLIEMVAAGQAVQVVVAEVSSFQLDTMDSFHPAVSVLLNVTEDHLDRYEGFDAYAASKARIFALQQTGDTAVINGADPLVRAMMPSIAAAALVFNGRRPAEAGADLSPTAIGLVLPGTGPRGRLWSDDLRDGARLDLSAFGPQGVHNRENAAAAALAALAAGGSLAGVQQAINRFKGLAHRMEKVADKNGAAWFDDSKATNVDAVARALDSFAGPLVLIMGGRDKGGHFADLAQRVKAKVKAIVLIGEAGPLIGKALAGTVPMVAATTMDDAVAKAAGIATAGDTVMLAPACASFDMFTSYAHRGQVFRRAVEALP